jgi:hydrogenase nickel incorporation protein HypA/HybF
VHEKHVIDDLIHQIIKQAEQKNAAKVSKISVWLGALSHMQPSHFKEHFEMTARGTLAENAQIAIETSDDIFHPHANRILLKSIEIE